MHERTMLLRLKRFDATQKAMKVAVLEKMIFDFDNTALTLFNRLRPRRRGHGSRIHSTSHTRPSLRRRPYGAAIC